MFVDLDTGDCTNDVNGISIVTVRLAGNNAMAYKSALEDLCNQLLPHQPSIESVIVQANQVCIRQINPFLWMFPLAISTQVLKTY
jgi:hypothetical protein